MVTTRRNTLRTLLGASAAAGILRGASRPAGDKPNLLFILCDERRPDTMAAYGNHRFHVPNVNRLAERSVVFDRCYVSQPVCSPSRSSLLTGQWPHTTGVLTNNITLPPSSMVLPQLLNDPAYLTAYYGKWHLGDEAFAQHGFQEWLSIEDGYNEFFSKGRDPSTISDFGKFLLHEGLKPDQPEHKTFSRVAEAHLPLKYRKSTFLGGAASDFILKNRSRPWMLFVSYLAPHMPFFGPLNDLHSAAEAPLPPNYPGYPIDHEPKVYQQMRHKLLTQGYKAYLSLPGHDLKSAASFERLCRNYAGQCAEIDLSIGRILSALEASGAAGNTIVVHTSDHGEMMGAHSLIGKEVMYEEAAKVPFLLHVPYRQNRGIHVAPPVNNVDVVPTLLSLMGAKTPESVQGENLLPMLDGNPRRDDHVYLEWNTVPGSAEASSVVPETAPNARTVVSPDGWKMVLHDRDSHMLFNTRQDPYEMHNVFYRPESKPQILALRRRLEAWQKRVNDKMPLPEVPA
ncbi:MAG TPA: sulfatase-like hydrolase/transferase [Bryobacteraceae bacterium]|nr:sulfatase-like hydrolase/transferase [Bryobacteraceae bacterium]